MGLLRKLFGSTKPTRGEIEAFQEALFKGSLQPEEVEALLGRQAALASAGTPDNPGWTALHSLADGSKPDVDENRKRLIRILLAAGVAVDAKDKFGRTPLHVAVGRDSGYVVELLLAGGADINTKDNDGRTALWRCYSQDVPSGADIVLFLLRNKADYKRSAQPGKVLLNRAASRGHLEVVKFLVGKGEDVKARDSTGRTPLDSAQWGDHRAVEDFLREHRAE